MNKLTKNPQFRMTQEQLKELVKEYFNLTEIKMGEIYDENKAFKIVFEGDKLELGMKVKVVTAEGQEMDAPDGEHRLEDGTRIVTKDSVVTEISSADGEKALAEEDVKEEMASETEEEAMEEAGDEEKMEETEEEMTEEEEVKMEVEEIVKAIVAEVKDEMSKMEEKMAALEEKVEAMEATPAAEPTITSTGKKMGAEAKRGFSAFDVNNAKNADRIKMAIDQLKTKKK